MKYLYGKYFSVIIITTLFLLTALIHITDRVDAKPSKTSKATQKSKPDEIETLLIDARNAYSIKDYVKAAEKAFIAKEKIESLIPQKGYLRIKNVQTLIAMKEKYYDKKIEMILTFQSLQEYGKYADFADDTGSVTILFSEKFSSLFAEIKREEYIIRGTAITESSSLQDVVIELEYIKKNIEND